MADKMTIDEAIKMYTSNAEYERTHDSLQGCLEFRQLAEWLKELKQLREKTKWIPVSERLPEDKQSVLVWCSQYKNIYCAYLEKKQWWIFGAFIQIVPNEVVAWMPLPKPYEPQESEDKE